MAQRSLPQAGNAVGDSGPYTGDEWAELFQTVFTGDQQATQGPIRHYLNELEVTEAALTVTIDTGAGFVYGHWLINDTSVGINIALAAAGLERWDRVVMVQNNTAVAYNTNLALPAAYAAGVPRNSARIAILQGTEAGAAVLPPLLTGPNYYMVELARYFMNDAAAGTVTDYRDYCGLGASGPSTQYLFVPVEAGYNVSTATTIPVTGDGTYWSNILMPNDQLSRAFAKYTLPGNYSSNMVIRAVHSVNVVGNIYASNRVSVGSCGGGTGTLYDSNVYAAEGVLTGVYNCVRSLDISALTLEQGHIFALQFHREARDAADTTDDVYFHGWLVSYTTLT